MAGERLVVSYEAIQSAQRVWSGAAGSIATVFGSIKPVGDEELYAKSLDAALKAYQAMVTKVGNELHAQAQGLASYLSMSEQTYRYVDATALTRAVPYNPDHPSPTLVVSSADSPPPWLPATAASIPGGAGGLRGTTAAGVPAGAHGAGTSAPVDPATAHRQYENLPTKPSLGTTAGIAIGGSENPVTGPEQPALGARPGTPLSTKPAPSPFSGGGS